MFTCTLQDHASAVASESRRLEPPYGAHEVILSKQEHIIHPVAVATPFFRARVRRSSVVELIAIVTTVIINRRLRRRRDWRDWRDRQLGHWRGHRWCHVCRRGRNRHG